MCPIIPAELLTFMEMSIEELKALHTVLNARLAECKLKNLTTNDSIGLATGAQHRRWFNSRHRSAKKRALWIGGSQMC